MRLALFSMVAAAALLAGGCAKYEYNLVQPANLTRHIGTGMDAVVQAEPFEYRMRTIDNRLVLRIYNQTDDTIMFLGGRSSVVDPDGQSHPLQGGPIAPQSFFKIILPPPRPQVYNTGPTFGVGVGMGVGQNSIRDPRMDDPASTALYGQPAYLAVTDENNALYWDWKGEGEVRLTLVFTQGEKEIQQSFTINRQKM